MSTSTLVSAPVFIVGCGRSGTTLLFDLLSQHPEFARTTGYPDGEDHIGWIEHGQCAMAGIGNVSSSTYGNGINGANYCLHLTEDDAPPEVVAAMHRYYSEEVLRGDGRRRVLNKQPHLSNKLRYLLRIFPDARVIHIVRDCVPVVASWMAIMDQHPALMAYLPDDPLPCVWLFPKPASASAVSAVARHPRFYPGGGGADLWIDYWTRVNSGIAPQMAAHRGQLHAVRYEDLVADPARVLGELVRFCGVADHAFDVSRIERNRASLHAGRLSASIRDRIAARAAEALARFGYTVAA
jgi:hypothetical protein